MVWWLRVTVEEGAGLAGDAAHGGHLQRRRGYVTRPRRLGLRRAACPSLWLRRVRQHGRSAAARPCQLAAHGSPARLDGLSRSLCLALWSTWPAGRLVWVLNFEFS